MENAFFANKKIPKKNAMAVSYGSPYATQEQRQQRFHGLRDAYLSGIMDIPMRVAEYLAPNSGHTPGELRSSPQDKMRGQRYAWDEYQQGRQQNPDYASGQMLGSGASMVADPFMDIPVAAAVKIAPYVGKLTRADFSGTNAMKSLSDILASQRGEVGDIVYHGTSEAFDKFKPEALGTSTRAESAKQGIWLVSDPETASGYAHYSARNSPVERLVDEANAAGDSGDWDKYDELITKAEKLESEINENMWRGQNIRPVKYEGDFSKVDMKGAEFVEEQEKINKLISKAKKEGKDGVIFKNLSDHPGRSNMPAEHTIVFDSKKIRSVFE